MFNLKELPYLAKIGIVIVSLTLVAAGLYYGYLVPIAKENELNELKLKLAAGILSESDLDAVNEWLQ